MGDGCRFQPLIFQGVTAINAPETWPPTTTLQKGAAGSYEPPTIQASGAMPS